MSESESESSPTRVPSTSISVTLTLGSAQVAYPCTIFPRKTPDTLTCRTTPFVAVGNVGVAVSVGGQKTDVSSTDVNTVRVSETSALVKFTVRNGGKFDYSDGVVGNEEALGLFWGGVDGFRRLFASFMGIEPQLVYVVDVEAGASVRSPGMAGHSEAGHAYVVDVEAGASVRSTDMGKRFEGLNVGGVYNRVVDVTDSAADRGVSAGLEYSAEDRRDSADFKTLNDSLVLAHHDITLDGMHSTPNDEADRGSSDTRIINNENSIDTYTHTYVDNSFEKRSDDSRKTMKISDENSLKISDKNSFKIRGENSLKNGSRNRSAHVVQTGENLAQTRVNVASLTFNVRLCSDENDKWSFQTFVGRLKGMVNSAAGRLRFLKEMNVTAIKVCICMCACVYAKCICACICAMCVCVYMCR
jgi:hypothetical protein